MTTAPEPVSAAASTAGVPASPARKRDSGPSVRIVEAADLTSYAENWERLAKVALAPNPFYEPWMLCPALDAHIAKDKLRFLLVLGPADGHCAEPLWGFFPLEIQERCMNLPIRTLAFWQHRWCYLTVPLIDYEHARETLDAFWRWFENNPFGCRALDTNQLLADGPFQAIWADFAIGRASYLAIDFPRAFLAAPENPSEYLADCVSKKHMDEYLRQERRLSEAGKLHYRQIESASELGAWLEEFLRLEACGWKGGPDGKAFAKEPIDAAYLETITREGFHRGQIVLLSLELDGKPIAMKHNILAGGGGFTTRIAYDENYSKYSPGLLLELENIRIASRHPRIQWLDSCADPRHVMANRIWRERRMIRQTIFSNASVSGDFAVATLALLRWIKKRLIHVDPPRHLQISTKLDHYRG